MHRVAVLLVLIGCNSPGDPGTTERRPAYIMFYGDTSTITVPTAVPVNAPFSVDFVTFGGGCIDKGETESAISGLHADVQPYQYVYHPRADEACTDELRFDRHTVTIQFAATGTATIRIAGLRAPGDDDATLTRTLTVTP